MWMQARVRLRGGAGPVLAPRDRQRDPVVGFAPGVAGSGMDGGGVVGRL